MGRAWNTMLAVFCTKMHPLQYGRCVSECVETQLKAPTRCGRVCFAIKARLRYVLFVRSTLSVLRSQAAFHRRREGRERNKLQVIDFPRGRTAKGQCALGGVVVKFVALFVNFISTSSSNIFIQCLPFVCHFSKLLWNQFGSFACDLTVFC